MEILQKYDLRTPGAPYVILSNLETIFFTLFRCLSFNFSCFLQYAWQLHFLPVLRFFE